MAKQESTPTPELGDFMDPRVFLVRPNDPRLGIVLFDAEDRCMYWQPCDGPTYVIVGPRASDEKCAKVAARYGYDVAQVMRFRDEGVAP